MRILLPHAKKFGRLRARLVFGLAASVLAGLMVGGLVLAVLAVSLLGFRVLVVRSDSMAPALQPGDLIVTRPAPIASAKFGDIVLFDEGERVHLNVAHRVAGIIKVEVKTTDSSTGKTTTQDSRLLITKGDANERPDGQEVDAARFRGLVWFSMPRMGELLGGPSLRRAAFAVAAASGAGWITYELWTLWLRGRARFRQNQAGG